MVSDRNASVRDDDAASPSSSFWQETRNNGNANRMTGRNFIRVEQKLPPPIAILIAFTALYIVLIIRFNIFSFSYAKKMQTESRTCQACLSNYAEVQLFLGTKLVFLLLRSKKKAEKCWNMMNFFFKTKKMQVKEAR